MSFDSSVAKSVALIAHTNTWKSAQKAHTNTWKSAQKAHTRYQSRTNGILFILGGYDTFFLLFKRWLS